MTLHEFLGIWQLDSRGRGIPRGHASLCREIEKLSPEVIGFKVVEQLQAEGFISTLPNGRRNLTAKGATARIPLPSQPAIKRESNEAHWTRFRNLCAYYADCVTQSEKQQEYLFGDSLNIKWFLPTLPIDWLSAQSFSISTQPSIAPAVNRIKYRREDEEEVYIGYPLAAFACSNGKTGYSPVMLFPVDVAWEHNLINLTVRRDEIDINRTWLEFNVPREEHQTVQMNFCFVEGDKTGLIDPELAVQYLNNRLVNHKKLTQPLNPNYLDYTVSGAPCGLLNQAAMFVGNPLKYSKTLKTELRDIANQPAAVLDQTALAYIFRDPPLPNEYERNPQILPMDFLDVPSNKEQYDALTHALNNNISRVQGPNGTGKSQVAVNLIANLVFNGASVLFASKNHKAVHAIVERAEIVSPDLPLVQFCTVPGDGGTGAVWHRQSLDDILGKCELLSREISLAVQDTRTFDDSLAYWHDCRDKIAEIDHVRAMQQDIAAKREYCMDILSGSASGVQITEAFRQRVESLAYRIREGEMRRTLWQRLFDFVLWRKHRTITAEKQIRDLLPQLSINARSTATLREQALRLCGDFADILALEKEEDAIRDKPKELSPELERKLADDIAFRRRHLKENYIYRRTRDALAVPESIRKGLQNAARRIQRQTLPFLANVLPPDNADAARDAFHQFAHFYPAWASTLLSLSKASPCIAGLFTRVIIDEASQCEIPPVIPALYRAKGVTVFGDPRQFPPVITMRENRHAHIRYTRHKLVDMPEQFDFMKENVFTLISAPPLMLREHFRCHTDIAGYFNDEYYNGKLRVRTNAERLRFPANMGFKRAVVWRDVHDSLDGEIAATRQILAELANNGYGGSIGVIRFWHNEVISDISQCIRRVNEKLS